MKKLMILAAVAVMAVASQAAAFKWTASGVNDINGTALYSGEATIYYYLSTEAASSAAVASAATMTDGAFSVTLSDDMFVAGKTYKFYYTMTDDKDNVFTSSTKQQLAHISQTKSVSFSSGGEWVAAPEPTSGLLLLLGVAGLALKRKQK